MSAKKGKRKILIGPSTFASASDAPLKRLYEAGFDVIDNPYKRKLTKSELLDLLRTGISGLIAGLEAIDREVLEKSCLRVVSRSGSGLSNVDIKAAAELGIIVRYTPTAPVNAVAELTLGCLLSLLRNVSMMDREMHRGEWSKRMGRELRGMKVAVVGYGNIGRRVAELLNAFGADVKAVDPLCSVASEGVELAELKDALGCADIITLHCSGDREVLGEKEFGFMKKGVLILNAARGKLVNETALASALDSGDVAGAWLDTFESEPYNGELCRCENVILTPHIGSMTRECRTNMEMQAVENLLEAFEEIDRK